MKKLYDSLKTSKTAELIITFMDEETKISPQSFIILDQIIQITEKSEYKLTLKDKSLYENKIYECFLDYGTEKCPYYIKIYYDQVNHYFFGRKKNSMCFEFIFGDFINDKIDNNRCYIEYNGKKYYSYDDKKFLKLRCLNLVNVDLALVKFPSDYNNKVVNSKYFDEKSFFIFVSVAEKYPKIFGIFRNKPFEEKQKMLEANDVIEKLESTLIKVRKILNYDKNQSYDEYVNGINMKELPTTYIKEIRNSVYLENEVMSFFNIYRPNLTDEELAAFDTYSEFMIAFPSFLNMNRTSNHLIPFRFYKQYYYSKKAIENFMETIPPYVDKVQKTLLKYSACRCLRSILSRGFGKDNEHLFYFYDISKPDNIYNEARKFNESFIKELNENSEMFLFLLQINSGSSINKLNQDLTSRISMLTLDQIKSHLKDSLPDYIIRLKLKVDFSGLTFNEVRHTIISEMNLFQSFLEESELKGKFDEYSNRRLILANLLQHERFGHINNSLNFFCFQRDTEEIFEDSYDSEDEPLSPRQYYHIEKKKEKLIEIVQTSNYLGKEVKKGESGVAFNIFLTRGDMRNFNILRNDNADFSKIFKDPKLFASKDLTTLNRLLGESVSNDEFGIFRLKNVSDKYEIIRERYFEPDNRPTIAKYY